MVGAGDGLVVALCRWLSTFFCNAMIDILIIEFPNLLMQTIITILVSINTVINLWIDNVWNFEGVISTV